MPFIFLLDLQSTAKRFGKPSGQDFMEVHCLGATPAGGGEEVHRLLRIPERAEFILLFLSKQINIRASYRYNLNHTSIMHIHMYSTV